MFERREGICEEVAVDCRSFTGPGLCCLSRRVGRAAGEVEVRIPRISATGVYPLGEDHLTFPFAPPSRVNTTYFVRILFPHASDYLLDLCTDHSSVLGDQAPFLRRPTPPFQSPLPSLRDPSGPSAIHLLHTPPSCRLRRPPDPTLKVQAPRDRATTSRATRTPPGHPNRRQQPCESRNVRQAPSTRSSRSTKPLRAHRSRRPIINKVCCHIRIRINTQTRRKHSKVSDHQTSISLDRRLNISFRGCVCIRDSQR